MREVLFLLDAAGEVLWEEAGEGPLALPDSRARWEALWQHRGALAEVAHSHPLGPDGFSAEDASTIAALEAALGRGLRFSVVTPRGTWAREEGRTARVEPEPRWAAALRRASGMVG